MGCFRLGLVLFVLPLTAVLVFLSASLFGTPDTDALIKTESLLIALELVLVFIRPLTRVSHRLFDEPDLSIPESVLEWQAFGWDMLATLAVGILGLLVIIASLFLNSAVGRALEASASVAVGVAAIAAALRLMVYAGQLTRGTADTNWRAFPRMLRAHLFARKSYVVGGSQQRSRHSADMTEPTEAAPVEHKGLRRRS